jgi:hypothetical protein
VQLLLLLLLLFGTAFSAAIACCTGSATHPCIPLDSLLTGHCATSNLTSSSCCCMRHHVSFGLEQLPIWCIEDRPQVVCST